MVVQYVVPEMCLLDSGSDSANLDFNLTRVTLSMVNTLGYKLFFVFGTMNLGPMLLFSMYVILS